MAMETQALNDRKALLLQRFSSTIAHAAIKLQESVPPQQAATAPTPTSCSYLSRECPSSDILRDSPPKKVQPLAAKKVVPPPPPKKLRLLGAPTKKVEAPCTVPSKKRPSDNTPPPSKKLHLFAAPAKNAGASCCYPSDNPSPLFLPNNAMYKNQRQDNYKVTALQHSEKIKHVLQRVTKNLPQASRPPCSNMTPTSTTPEAECPFLKRKPPSNRMKEVRTHIQSESKDAGKAPKSKHKTAHATHPLPTTKLPCKEPSDCRKEVHKQLQLEENDLLQEGKTPQPERNQETMHATPQAAHPLPQKGPLWKEVPSGYMKQVHKKSKVQDLLQEGKAPQPEHNQEAMHATPDATAHPLSKKRLASQESPTDCTKHVPRKTHFAKKDFSQERAQEVVHATLEAEAHPLSQKWPTSQELPKDYMRQAACRKIEKSTKKDFLNEGKGPQSEPYEDAMHAALEVARNVMQERTLKQRQHDREEARRALDAVEANARIEDAWQTTTEFLQLLSGTSQYAQCEVPLGHTYASNLDCAGRLHINFLGTY